VVEIGLDSSRVIHYLLRKQTMAKVPMLIDETGQPYIILRDQMTQERVTGIDALKSNIYAAMALGQTIRTSYGPRGMDKALLSKDGDVTVTNDGRTILESMDITNEIARLIVELSIAHDDEVGDGTTGVAILACSLCEQAAHLIEKGLHPIRIAEGYSRAAEEACKYLETIADTIHFTKEDTRPLLAPAKSCISSKIINRQSEQMARIAVDAVCSVCDWDRKDVHFDHIKIESKVFLCFFFLLSYFCGVWMWVDLVFVCGVRLVGAWKTRS
jgi:T-complex protein 1 subunit epsilon